MANLAGYFNANHYEYFLYISLKNLTREQTLLKWSPTFCVWKIPGIQLPEKSHQLLAQSLAGNV
jgi:hypothetical protein